MKKDGDDGSALKHVFVIMLENHSQSSVIDDVNAPYITQLAHSNAMAAQYYGVTHPSEPNYVAAISGSNWFVNDDNPAHRYDHTNLVDQLEANGLDLGRVHGVDALGRLPRRLRAGLDPALRVEAQPVRALQRHPRRTRRGSRTTSPIRDFATDLQKVSTTPNFAFIVPNQCHDMHGGVFVQVAPDGSDGTPCPFGSTKDDANDAALKQKADAFVKDAVTTIESSPVLAAGIRRDLRHHRRERLHRERGHRRLGERSRLLRLADPASGLPVPELGR